MVFFAPWFYKDGFEKRWAIIRQLGPIDFIFTRGIFGYGTAFALAMICTQTYQGQPPTVSQLIITVPINVLLCGGTWGTVTWFILDQKYKRIQAAQKSQAAAPF